MFLAYEEMLRLRTNFRHSAIFKLADKQKPHRFFPPARKYIRSDPSPSCDRCSYCLGFKIAMKSIAVFLVSAFGNWQVAEAYSDPEKWVITRDSFPSTVTCLTQLVEQPGQPRADLEPTPQTFYPYDLSPAIRGIRANYGNRYPIGPFESGKEHWEVKWKGAGWDHKSIKLRWTVDLKSNHVSWNGAATTGLVSLILE